MTEKTTKLFEDLYSQLTLCQKEKLLQIERELALLTIEKDHYRKTIELHEIELEDLFGG